MPARASRAARPLILRTGPYLPPGRLGIGLNGVFMGLPPTWRCEQQEHQPGVNVWGNNQRLFTPVNYRPTPRPLRPGSASAQPIASRPALRSPLARFGSHQVFPERQQTVIADGPLQRDVFDQEMFPAPPGPCFANVTGFLSSIGKSDDVIHGRSQCCHLIPRAFKMRARRPAKCDRDVNGALRDVGNSHGV